MDEVYLDYTEREVCSRLLTGSDPKCIAGAMEIAVKTVYRYLESMCDRAKVLDRHQLVLWVLQHPSCMYQGVGSVPGLHIKGCECGSGGCLGALAASLAPAQASRLLRLKS